jgi:hypothetical protein
MTVLLAWLRWWWSRLHQLQPTERLELALERLSICETPPDKTPYRDLIPGIARQLTIMRRNDGRPSASMAVQLKPVVLHLRALAQGVEWKDGLGDPPPTYSLPHQLRLRLTVLAGEAGALSQDIEAFLADIPRRPRGAPKHTAAPQIALYLYQEFERLTGRNPTRSVAQSGDEGGEFTTLVREVFEILGVKASPEQAARHAIVEATKPMVINQEID